ncbi:hypothetical protein [Dolichospermum sp. UHCC 0259]|nr:hypothetical protein [Dolichospermum sp. UHCC 0259]
MKQPTRTVLRGFAGGLKGAVAVLVGLVVRGGLGGNWEAKVESFYDSWVF